MVIVFVVGRLRTKWKGGKTEANTKQRNENKKKRTYRDSTTKNTEESNGLYETSDNDRNVTYC